MLQRWDSRFFHELRAGISDLWEALFVSPGDVLQLQGDFITLRSGWTALRPGVDTLSMDRVQKLSAKISALWETPSACSRDVLLLQDVFFVLRGER